MTYIVVILVLKTGVVLVIVDIAVPFIFVLEDSVAVELLV